MTTDAPMPKSPMQMQVLDILADGNWHGHRELAMKVTHNVRDLIRKLKKKGWDIQDRVVTIPDSRQPGKTKQAKEWRLNL